MDDLAESSFLSGKKRWTLCSKSENSEELQALVQQVQQNLWNKPMLMDKSYSKVRWMTMNYMKKQDVFARRENKYCFIKLFLMKKCLSLYETDGLACY